MRLTNIRISCPLTLSIVSTLAAALIGAEWQSWLRYERDALLEGELWRLISGQFLHLGWGHLFMNLAGLWMIWWIFWTQPSVKSFWMTLLFVMLGVSAGTLIWSPEVAWYVGLSGALHGMLVAGLVPGLMRYYLFDWILFGCVILKVGYEQKAGPVAGSESLAGGAVIVDAHLYGAISGVIAGLLLGYLSRQRADQDLL